MGLAIFENYSQTKEGTNYSPLIVHTSQVHCFDLMCKWINNNSFSNVEINKDFFEIYAEADGFEITISVGEEEHNALLNVSVYGKTGKTRKKLKEYLSKITDYLK